MQSGSEKFTSFNRARVDFSETGFLCARAQTFTGRGWGEFSSPEPVVSWSRGWETRVGYKLSRVALGTRMVGGGDEKERPLKRRFVRSSKSR